MKIYIIGSMRNPKVTEVAKVFRSEGFTVFDDWISPGDKADEQWKEYEMQRGRLFADALDGDHARHVFEFDKYHLLTANVGVLVLPAGKSAHTELGFLSGVGTKTLILLDNDPERYDVMAQFGTEIFSSIDELVLWLKTYETTLRVAYNEVVFPQYSDMIWLAGLLEGEGCFTASNGTARMVLQMTDKDVVERAAKIMGSTVLGPYRYTVKKKPVYVTEWGGIKALAWMRVLRYYMGERRTAKIDEILANSQTLLYRQPRSHKNVRNLITRKRVGGTKS